MPKNTITYWNALDTSQDSKWKYIEGSNHLIEQITLAIDPLKGDYTRLTRFKEGANTKEFGATSHDYPEEIFIVKGKLYDETFDKWLIAGDYASRPAGEVHGPFKSEGECIVLEMSYPSQSVKLKEGGG